MANLCRQQQQNVRMSSFSVQCCIETKECSFVYGLVQTYNLAKQIVITDKSLCSFLVFVSVAVKHLTRSDGIRPNQL
jgi:hypothetical protein